MSNNIFSFLKKATLGLAVAVTLTSCNEDPKDNPNVVQPVKPSEVVFNLGYGVGYRGTAEGTILPLTEAQLKSGHISFENNGYKLEKARTHRLYSTNNGKVLYFLSYTNNELEKYEVTGDNNLYKKLGVIDIKPIMGNVSARWRVVNEKTALVYGITPVHKTKEIAGEKQYDKTESIFTIATIDLENFQIGNVKTYPIDSESNDKLPNLHIWRVDQPEVQNGKVYIGTAKRGYDPASDKNISEETSYATSVISLDFPSLENLNIISSAVSKGQNYGYRSPSIVSYNNSVYNLTMNNSKILKITNGKFDNNYDFDLAKALGMEKVGANGIFYVDNGIAYVTFFDEVKGRGSDAKAWGVARVDLNNKTAIKMNVPNDMWLWYYQDAKAVNGKLYMALNSLGQDGNIYIFDSSKADANGFEKGASLATTGEGFYIGIF